MKRLAAAILTGITIASLICLTACNKEEPSSQEQIGAATPIPTSKDDIILGASFPLSGDNASYGTDAKEGIELALEEINRAGGIDGRKVKVIFEDDMVDPKNGVSIMQKFVSIDKVPVVLGSAGSGVSTAMAPIANREKVVLISPISSAASLTEAGPFFFRTCPSDAAQAEIVAECMIEKGHRKVGVLYIINAWGVGLKQAFKKAFEEKGGKVVNEEGAEEQVTDFRAQLNKLKAANCDALYMPTYSKQGGRILTQAKDLGISVPIYGGDTWGAQELFDAAGSAADGVFFVVPEKFEGEQYQSFSKKYKAKYGKQPNFNASSSYDCMHVIAKALQSVVDAKQKITGDNVRKALAKVTFNGATGLSKFDAKGDVTGKEFGRRVIRDGKAIPVE